MESIVVRGATLKRDMATVVLIGVPNKPGMAAEIFARLGRHRIVVDDIMQNIYEGGGAANIGFSIGAADLPEARAIGEELARELGLHSVEVDEHVAKVSLVGVGMKTHTGVAAKTFHALAEAKVNIQHISTSEIVISCIVHEDDGEKALQVLHEAFELEKEDAG